MVVEKCNFISNSCFGYLYLSGLSEPLFRYPKSNLAVVTKPAKKIETCFMVAAR